MFQTSLQQTRPPAAPVTSRSVRDGSTRLATTSSLRVSIEAPPLLCAGLRALLGEHPEAIKVGRWDVIDTDVVIVDVSTQHGPIRLPTTPRPLVALTREGDLEADKFVRDIGGVTAAVTSTTASLIAAVQTAYTLQRMPQVPDGDHHRGPGKDPIDPLSPREIEVLHAICLGMTNSDIASHLYLSINSVKTYIRSAYRKMGVRGRSQAILWGIDRGYNTALTPPPTSGPRDSG